MSSHKKSEGGRPAVHERLRKLLLLVPYVAKNPGITVDALAQQLGMGKEQLLEDLDMLAMVGRPPFQPDDYIDVFVDGDRVYINLDQRLSAPPRLTASEAAALAKAAELFAPVGSAPLQSAMRKLERVLPPAAMERFREMGQKLDLAEGGPSELAPVARAILERKELEFDYFSAERASTERRTVRPYELFSHLGQWYLSAFCCTRQDDRLFRLDRMKSLALTERTFSPVQGRRSALPDPSRGAAEVRVRFTPTSAPYVRERFGEGARPLPDGGVEVKVSGDSPRWLTQWVMSFAGEAEVISPAWAREAVARAARASLES